MLQKNLYIMLFLQSIPILGMQNEEYNMTTCTWKQYPWEIPTITISHALDRKNAPEMIEPKHYILGSLASEKIPIDEDIIRKGIKWKQSMNNAIEEYIKKPNSTAEQKILNSYLIPCARSLHEINSGYWHNVVLIPLTPDEIERVNALGNFTHDFVNDCMNAIDLFKNSTTLKNVYTISLTRELKKTLKRTPFAFINS